MASLIGHSAGQHQVTNTCTQVQPLAPQGLQSDLVQVAHLLPDMVRDLGDRVGIYEAFNIAKIMGGTSTYIPKSENSETAKNLIKKIGGAELAGALINAYGGEVLYIPSCSAAVRELRNIEIHNAAAAGISAGRAMNNIVNELALIHLVSDRHIWRILKKLPPHLSSSTAGNAGAVHTQLKPTPEIH